MDRLTNRLKDTNEIYYYKNGLLCNIFNLVRYAEDDNENQLLINISDKLAAYEDIGTPQELAELKAENDRLKDKLEEIERLWEQAIKSYAELVETQRENERLKGLLNEK